ncbi:hypothetical protein [Kitasatospora sp. NPDC057738]|uniref:hypothetical protein n=1 Tax=Kitasatospora sp. NPDC057738 TaxID=3346233 RepID=UPI0036CE0908
MTALGRRLVAEECSAYSSGPQWTGADHRSYTKWWRKCGCSGSAADGIPGQGAVACLPLVRGGGPRVWAWSRRPERRRRCPGRRCVRGPVRRPGR